MNPPTITETQLLDKNRHFYNSLWGGAQLVEAEKFNTWPLVSSLLNSGQRRLEVAPGLRPRLPIKETHFVDISQPALDILQARGGSISSASICDLPFADQSFDLICALDIIEHVDDDRTALAELSRVAAEGALLLISTPLHQELWTPFDDMVGHRRRYQPEAFITLLQEQGFSVKQSAVFGMKPKSSRLVDLGMRLLQRRPKRAFWWYNKIMPLTLRFQKKLKLVPGLLDTAAVSDIFLVCQRMAAKDGDDSVRNNGVG
ncbi:MAG TPA: class I SAM-dependent methyltransferase [Cellvibrio sp.]|nr:class I SAM-dependent methyltransferase [Cellvibrio sp.]